MAIHSKRMRQIRENREKYSAVNDLSKEDAKRIGEDICPLCGRYCVSKSALKTASIKQGHASVFKTPKENTDVCIDIEHWHNERLIIYWHT